MLEAEAEVEDDPLIFPWEAVRAETTKLDRLRKSRYFLEFAGEVNPKLILHRSGPKGIVIEREKAEIRRGMESFIMKARSNPQYARSLVIRFIEHERLRIEKGEIGAEHLRNMLKPVRLAVELNEVYLPWKKLMRLIPGEGRKARDREYTLEEIRRLLAVAPQHMRIAILFMASSGMRIGAFDYLRVGDISPLEENGALLCGKVRVYADTEDEYQTLISKEAYLRFVEYLEARKLRGEEIRPDSSPAITLKGSTKAASSGTIRNNMGYLLRKANIRREKRKRYEVMADHGLRKYFDNALKDHVREEYVEKLLGHDTGVKEHYDRRLPRPLIEQYLAAMPFISIDEGFRASAAPSAAAASNSKLLSMIDTLEQRVKALEGELKDRDQTLVQVREILRKLENNGN